MKKKLVVGLVGLCLAGMSAPAFAGQWNLNPRACPDLREDRADRREDRRDARRNYGYRDRAEDRWDRRDNRRDEAVTICPISAFYYEGNRREARRYAKARPPLAWDRRARMYYRYNNGIKIYVRT
ncbi:hypothetical protein ABFZ85_09380 [Hyphococcus formosus]|uniref:hypothetical protein n=1 Tax=Hyphococcus formosus TaxID=3143534 RepID=UPI00398B047F